jgi:hypothetical protein
LSPIVGKSLKSSDYLTHDRNPSNVNSLRDLTTPVPWRSGTGRAAQAFEDSLVVTPQAQSGSTGMV